MITAMDPEVTATVVTVIATEMRSAMLRKATLTPATTMAMRTTSQDTTMLQDTPTLTSTRSRLSGT